MAAFISGSPRTYALFALAAAVSGSAQAAKISGTIASTMTLTEDSQLTGNVNCTVSGAPCIVVNAPGITLSLKGYTMTGQGNALTGCNGAATANEIGILVTGTIGATVQGPGLVQRFRNAGVQLINSTGVTVSRVTASTNCTSGILIGGGGGNTIIGNVSVRNGNGGAPCGGI